MVFYSSFSHLLVSIFEKRMILNDFATSLNTRSLTSNERFEKFLIESESVLPYKVLIKKSINNF